MDVSLDTFKPLLPVFFTALGFWSFLKLCRFIYRLNRRIKKGIM